MGAVKSRGFFAQLPGFSTTEEGARKNGGAVTFARSKSLFNDDKN